MFWTCMSIEGIVFATNIDGKIDADLCTAILEDVLQMFLEHWGKDVVNTFFSGTMASSTHLGRPSSGSRTILLM